MEAGRHAHGATGPAGKYRLRCAGSSML